MKDDVERLPETEEDFAVARETILSQARLQKTMMARLIDDVAFQSFIEELQKQIDHRFHELLQMPTGSDDMVKKNYVAGEISGIKLALDLPRVLIEYAQTSIDSARINEENINGQTAAARNATYFGNGNTDQSDFFDGNPGG